MVFALHKFRHYLLGNKFVFYVDHMALVYLVNKPHVLGKQLDGYYCSQNMTSHLFINQVEPMQLYMHCQDYKILQNPQVFMIKLHMLLWTGLGRSKARKPGYNQARKYKTRQDKTRQGNIGGLGALLIHQLVLVCWRAVPQTISFYNPEPSYTRSSLMAYAERCQDVVALPRRGCIAETSRRGYTVRMPRRGYVVETPRHGSIVKTNLSYFCVVGSKP